MARRLTATMTHLTDPAGRVYMLTMEGLLFETDVATLKCTLVADVVKQFGIRNRPHFKGGFTGQGRVIVANNGFYDYGEQQAGLFEWDGRAWRAISRKPHMDGAGRANMGNVVFCTGWDEASVLLGALVEGKWKRNRLPRESHAFMHGWQTEWMRLCLPRVPGRVFRSLGAAGRRDGLHRLGGVHLHLAGVYCEPIAHEGK